MKIALNYRLYDYGAPPTLDELAGNVQRCTCRSFQTEFGGRYVYGWTRFQKDQQRQWPPRETTRGSLGTR